MSSHLVAPDRADERWSWRRTALFGTGAVVLGVVLVIFPPARLLGSVFGVDERPRPPAVAPAARGASGEVRLQVRLPGETFPLPVEASADGPPLRYHWVRAADSSAVTADTAVAGGTVIAPTRPGLYHLALRNDANRIVIGDVLVGVLVPFAEKLGNTLNGYRIGRYRFERARGDATPPPKGFVEVWPEDVGLYVTDHLQLADFVTHDSQQDTWPKYVALDPRVLDKVELVLDRLGARERLLTVDVHSGFRTPLYNRRVPRAAGDSRHQYGDAIDLALDADLDGRVSFFDMLAVSRAVEAVERDHPELVGGMGLYGNRGTAPYVHIDVRGERKRWRG